MLQQGEAGTGGGGAPAAGAPSAGATNTASGMSGGDDLDAGAGKAGSQHGFGGYHGFGGATAAQSGGGSAGNQEPCLSGDQCTDGGLNCPPTMGYCKRCTTNKDCTDGDARFCDTQDGRCAECRVHADDCPAGDVCHPLTLRCMHSCNVSTDCVFDGDKPQCDPFGACVSCNDPTDCRQIGRPNDVCVFGTCAECYDDKQCRPERPYCVGLICQTKR